MAHVKLYKVEMDTRREGTHNQWVPTSFKTKAPSTTAAKQAARMWARTHGYECRNLEACLAPPSRLRRWLNRVFP